jgi:nitrate reductase gamma subunit
LPVHLRWELYPVAHETKRPYGGSYFEDLNWWDKPRSKSLIGELKFMVTELFFFRLYYRLRRKYWYWVYPFHMGTFLLVGWFVLLLVGAIYSLTGIDIGSVSSSIWGTLVYYFTLIVGVVGFFTAGLGIIGLLVLRVTDRSLKRYTTPFDYINMLFILAIIISGLVAWYLFDREFVTLREFVKSLITFNPMISVNPVTYSNALLICIFLIYSPFTRMTHYIAKYFTYHKVLWDDIPNMDTDDTGKQLKQLLNQVPNWSDPHIQPGRSWKQLAEDMPDDKIK